MASNIAVDDKDNSIMLTTAHTTVIIHPATTNDGFHLNALELKLGEARILVNKIHLDPALYSRLSAISPSTMSAAGFGVCSMTPRPSEFTPMSPPANFPRNEDEKRSAKALLGAIIQANGGTDGDGKE